MAENPIRDYQTVPNDTRLYDDSVDISVLLDWQGRNWPTFSYFYDHRFYLDNYVNPSNFAERATQPSPDSVLIDFQSRSYACIPFLYPVDLESAPAVAHTTDFRIAVLIYTKETFVDPGGDGDGGTCRAAPVACTPLADLELAAAPIADIEMVLAPEANLEMNPTPVATLECRIST